MKDSRNNSRLKELLAKEEQGKLTELDKEVLLALLIREAAIEKKAPQVAKAKQDEAALFAAAKPEPVEKKKVSWVVQIFESCYPKVEHRFTAAEEEVLAYYREQVKRRRKAA